LLPCGSINPSFNRVEAVTSKSTRTVQRLVAIAIAPMVAVTLAFAFTGDRLQKPIAAGLYWSYLVAASILVGLYWWRRRPALRFGPLLIAFGLLAWIVSWQGSNAPLLFDIGVLAEGPIFALTFYLFLAFPMGRIEPRAARWLMYTIMAAVIGFFLPWALFSPVISGAGALSRCAPNCPPNVLQIASAPRLVDVAGKAETYTALSVTVAVLVVYGLRLFTSSRPQRRALMAVAVTSLLWLPAYFVYNFAGSVLYLDRGTLDNLQWGIVVTRVLLPVGFLVALLQAQLFAMVALRTLLERLATRPAPEQWRDTIAEALDDPSLRLGFRDPVNGQFLEPGGERLVPHPAGAHREWVPITRDSDAVAAMVIDESLTADPELVHAAASATLLAVENGALEGELRASRARILEAGLAERRRIERDLHDSAQQRLVALRIHLTLAGEQLDRDRERQMLETLGLEVDETIEELRDVAHGLYPQLLVDRGLRTALDAVARRAGLRVTVVDGGLPRFSEALETTIYFCCLECLQNATKHAGAGASVTIRLAQNNGNVSFTVEDDGAGFDLGTVQRGAGLTNLSDRVAAVGGMLSIDSRPGKGTRVTGDLPVAHG
jgi:signal transduction histidine kinase